MVRCVGGRDQGASSVVGVVILVGVVVSTSGFLMVAVAGSFDMADPGPPVGASVVPLVVDGSPVGAQVVVRGFSGVDHGAPVWVGVGDQEHRLPGGLALGVVAVLPCSSLGSQVRLVVGEHLTGGAYRRVVVHEETAEPCRGTSSEDPGPGGPGGSGGGSGSDSGGCVFQSGVLVGLGPGGDLAVQGSAPEPELVLSCLGLA